jgi:hypothetical protein
MSQEFLSINQDVMTPNGPGVVDGRFGLNILVRHTIKDMTSRDKGECLTPSAIVSGIWAYPESDVKVIEKKNGNKKMRWGEGRA